jgi:hypothetical protein
VRSRRSRQRRWHPTCTSHAVTWHRISPFLSVQRICECEHCGWHAPSLGSHVSICQARTVHSMRMSVRARKHLTAREHLMCDVAQCATPHPLHRPLLPSTPRYGSTVGGVIEWQANDLPSGITQPGPALVVLALDTLLFPTVHDSSTSSHMPSVLPMCHMRAHARTHVSQPQAGASALDPHLH